MPESFPDHFSEIAETYAASRPRYPAELFVWLASLVQRRNLAWECAAGSGQATLDLAAIFERVIATDASAAQLAQAPAHPRIEYRVARAEQSGLEAGSADLIVVAQALHWFDLDRFYAEVHRVLAPAGILAVWTYGLQQLDDEPLDRILEHFYSDIVGPFWPPERRIVETGYRTIPFPFHEVMAPDFVMVATWTLPELLGYMRPWSSTTRYRAAKGRDPVEDVAKELSPHWGGAGRVRRVVWPLRLRAGGTEP